MSNYTDTVPHPVGQAQAELDALMAAVTATHDGFHKVELFPRNGKRPPDRVLNRLGARWLPEVLQHEQRRDWWLPQHRKVIVVAPDADIRGRIGQHTGWRFGNIELARDRIFRSIADAESMLDFYVRHGVQPWHRSRVMNSYAATRYMGEKVRPGFNVKVYADSPSDFTGEVPCYHFEVTVVGKQARERLGLRSPADLPKFTAAQIDTVLRRYERYAVIDFERLGRTNSNLRTGDDRRRPRVARYGDDPGFDYNYDLREGGILFCALGSHPAHPPRSPVSRRGMICRPTLCKPSSTRSPLCTGMHPRVRLPPTALG